MRNLLLLTLLSLCAALDTSAQSGATLNEFESLKTFRCDFRESEGRRTSADGTTTPARHVTFADLVLDGIDYRENTARFIGNAGSEDVTVINGQLTVSFIETTPTGDVNVLSIFKRTGSLGVYRAAYSRHLAFTRGGLTISQSFGACRGLA